jgi:hypothetical protein
MVAKAREAREAVRDLNTAMQHFRQIRDEAYRAVAEIIAASDTAQAEATSVLNDRAAMYEQFKDDLIRSIRTEALVTVEEAYAKGTKRAFSLMKDHVDRYGTEDIRDV